MQAVRDVNDAAPFGFQFGDDAEQGLGFAVGEGVGRLVHDDDAALEAERLGDFYHLLFAHGKLAHRGVAGEGEGQPRQQRIGVAVEFFPVDAAEAG